MTKKKEKNDDELAYLAIGIVFVVASVGFFFNDSSRALSYVFVTLGITFLILSMNNKTKKK